MAGSSGQRNDKTTHGFNLRDIVYVLFRRRLIVAAVLLPIIVVASLGLFKDTGTTIAGCKILIELQAPETPRWNTRAAIDYDRSLSTLIHMAMSAPVARMAAEALQDSLPVILELEEGAFARLANINELTQFIFDRLDVSPIGESSILNLRFRSRNPRLALMAVEACRDAFLKYAITATKNTHALEYYDDQVRLVRDEVDALLSQRARVVQQAGFGSVEFDLRGISQQLIDMRNNNLKNTLERTYQESRIATMRAALARDPDYTPSPDRPGVGIAMLNAKDQVDDLRGRLMALLVKFTDDHIEVRRAREQLAGARGVLREEVDNYIRTYEIEVEALRVKEETMQAQIHNLEHAMTTIPELSRQITLFDTELNAKTQLLKDLQVKRGEVLINTGADERIASIIRLTEPEIEAVISEARKFIYFGLIVFFGLVLALTVAIVIDSRDHRLHAPERVETQLGVPVLAAVSEQGSRKVGS